MALTIGEKVGAVIAFIPLVSTISGLNTSDHLL